MDGAATRQSMADDLRRLGLRTGDQVLVRASLRAVGPVKGAKAEAFINAVMDVLGPEGLLLGLSFSRQQIVFLRRKSVFYDKKDVPITGGFASSMLKHPGSFRTPHPTNSFVGIGKIPAALREHGPDKACFHPMKHLVEAQGKMLLVGCTSSSPGFSTVHLAQNDLGLATRTRFRGLFGQYYHDGRALVWYSKQDFPGCSAGFWKFYDVYRERGLLIEGHVGQATSYSIEARAAYEAERRILSENPAFPLCDSDTCVYCRVGLNYKNLEIVRFVCGGVNSLVG